MLMPKNWGSSPAKVEAGFTIEQKLARLKQRRQGSEDPDLIEPAAWATPTGVEASAKKVIARIDMSQERAGAGLCPECGSAMAHSHTNGHEVLVCSADRIVLPLPDDPDEDPGSPGTPEVAVQGPSTALGPV